MNEPGCRRLCLELSIHYPYFVETRAQREDVFREEDIIFSRSQKADFGKYLSRAVLPAMDCIFSWLDSGESGTVIEQLITEETDRAAVLLDTLQHPSVESIGQTYYRSVAGLFPDPGEFIFQVSRHADLIEDLSGRRPGVFEANEFVFNSALIDPIRDLGFLAFYTEGSDHLLSTMNPNYVYSCHNFPVLLRNCRLSEDIAQRFHDHTWDRFPLTAETYARWVAETPGDCIHIRLDAGVFSTTGDTARSFEEFICRLPQALHSHGVATVLPSSVIGDPPRKVLHLEELGMCAPGTVTALTGIHNMHQQSAFWCLEDARDLIIDRESWRRLQSIDHFARMAFASGSCGRGAMWSTSQEAYDYFSAYLRALASCEEACRDETRSPPAARALQCQPPETAFHFHSGFRFTGYSAHSLQEFSRFLEFIPDEVFQYHQERMDFSRWISGVLGDDTLAGKIARCTQSSEAAHLVQERIQELWDLLR